MKKFKKQFSKYGNSKTFILSVAFVVAAPLAIYTLPDVTKTNYESGNSVAEESVQTTDEEKNAPPSVVHAPVPDYVRAIYMTACVAGTHSFREDLVELVEETELNSIIIDIKDYSGTVSFPTKSPLLLGAWESAQCGARDMEEFIKELHAKDIYVIGRITVFQDPYYSVLRPDLAVKKESDGSVWKDHKGLSFIDVGAREYWDYIVELSKESYNVGFDELNFDYIRFPSDGNMKDIAYTHSSGNKAEQLEKFFKYLNEHLTDPALTEGTKHVVRGSDKTPRPILSADLFGMTTTNTDDLNIGQVLERALPHFDYIAPMVYPSHYPTGFNGWINPNNYPYDVVNFSMKTAVERAIATTTTVVTLDGELLSTTSPFIYSKFKYDPDVLRPWIQDFDYGGDYDIAEVRAQIKGVYDAGLDSWMLWAPSNRYTRGALDSAPVE